jgi:hypothetical protein
MTSTTTGRSSASDTAGSTSGQGSTTSGDDRLQQAAGNLADQAGRTAEAKASTAMDQLGQALEQFAQATHEASDSLRPQQPAIADAVDTAANKVTEASRYLREHEAREIVATAEDAARRQPALVIAGGFALGLVAARLLRSATPSSYSGSSYRPTWHSGSDWYSSGASTNYSRGGGRRMGDTSSQLSSGADYSTGGDYAAGRPGYSSAPYAGGTAGTTGTTATSRSQARTPGSGSGDLAGDTPENATNASTTTTGSSRSTGTTGSTGKRRSMSESTQGEGS